MMHQGEHVVKVGDITYRAMMTRCRKENCSSCRDGGEGHGPYWYSYQSVQGHTLRKYVGKQLPVDLASQEHPIQSIGRPHAHMFVGREQEYRQLQTLLATIAHGQGEHLPHCVVVDGEAGIGKTRLVEEVACKAQDWIVLWSQAYTHEEAPYLLWTALIQDALQRRPHLKTAFLAFLQAHPAAARSLAPLIPVIYTKEMQEEQEQTQGRLWEACYELLTFLAAHKPLLLVLDDLHWADRASLELFTYFVHRVSGSRLCLLATCREHELAPSHPLQYLLQDGQREHHVLTLSLAPLSDEQISTLLTAVPESLVQPIRQRAAGNPLFAEILAHDAQEMGAVEEHEERRLPSLLLKRLPMTIAAVFQRRLEHLSPPCQRLLSRASALGAKFPYWLLEAMEHEREEETVLSLLDEALQAGLLTEENYEDGVTYAFWHPLLVSHLYEQLSVARRASLHRRIAQILCATYTTLEDEAFHAATIVHHLLHSNADASLLARYAEIAADHALKLSVYPDAERYYLLALQQMQQQSHAQRTSLLEALAECLRVQGKYEQARTRYQQAVDMHQSLSLVPDERETATQAMLLCEIGWTWQDTGDTAQASQCNQQAQKLLLSSQITDGPAWANVYYQQSYFHWLDGEYDQALKAAEQAKRLFEAHLSVSSPSASKSISHTRLQRTLAGDPVDAGRVQLLLATLETLAGRTTQAEAYLQTALTLFERYNCQNEVTTTCCNLGDVYLRQARYDQAREYLERAVDNAERIGDVPNQTVAEANLGILALRQQRFQQAEHHVRRGLTLAHQIHDPIYLSLFYSVLASIHERQYRFQAAHEALSSALSYARTTRNRACLAAAFVAFSSLRIAQITNQKRSSSTALLLVHRTLRTLQRIQHMEEAELETRLEATLVLARAYAVLHQDTQAQAALSHVHTQADHYGFTWLSQQAQALLTPTDFITATEVE